MAINVLPPLIANQIAAGEVVSRPASVVKELIENSIDAGATNITLIVKDAGRSLIEVIDNGCGMDREDCKKCFLPHATSKISTSEDLRTLSTMGFRGEALSSIASIAQVELKSKRTEQELGTLICIEGGEIKRDEETVCKQGTDIKVKNIFFNTPARRNFLKSDNIENSHIDDAFVKIALIYNDVAFTYYNNDKIVYKLDKANDKKRIVDIFGNSFKSKLLDINEKVDIVNIHGYISTLELSRKNKNEEYFFVNGRYMKNNYMANAVERVYSNLLPEKTFPVFFISLELDPKNIDVNIHPTKTEIKFLDDKLIYSILHAAVRKALGQNTLSTQLDFEKKDIVFPASKPKTPIYQPSISYNSSYNPFSQGLNNERFNEALPEKVSQSQLAFANQGFDNEIKTQQDIFAPFQFLNKYIVTKMHDSIMLIDQHRASKNIIYNRLLQNQSPEIVCQKLVIPYIYNVSKKDYSIIKNKLSDLQGLGFELKEKDEQSFELIAVPLSLSIEKAIGIIEELVAIDENTELDLEEKREKHCLRLADNLAITYGIVLNKVEIMKLIAELFKLSHPETLPNGEKVILKLNEDFLSKIF